MAHSTSVFYDHLNLLKRSFDNVRLIVFVGKSGSGKSTSLQFLSEHHPKFKKLKSVWYYQEGKQDEKRLLDAELVIVDEVLHWKELWLVWRLLSSGKLVLVASHVSPWLLRLFFPVPKRIFRTDLGKEKIRQYLRARSIGFSESALDLFYQKYSAVYTEVDVIMERASGDDFDYALGKFEKFDKVTFMPEKSKAPCR